MKLGRTTVQAHPGQSYVEGMFAQLDRDRQYRPTMRRPLMAACSSGPPLTAKDYETFYGMNRVGDEVKSASSARVSDLAAIDAALASLTDEQWRTLPNKKINAMLGGYWEGRVAKWRRAYQKPACEAKEIAAAERQAARQSRKEAYAAKKAELEAQQACRNSLRQAAREKLKELSVQACELALQQVTDEQWRTHTNREIRDIIPVKLFVNDVRNWRWTHMRPDYSEEIRRQRLTDALYTKLASLTPQQWQRYTNQHIASRWGGTVHEVGVYRIKMGQPLFTDRRLDWSSIPVDQWQQLTDGEIARLLGCCVNTVRQYRMKRPQLKLRRGTCSFFAGHQGQDESTRGHETPPADLPPTDGLLRWPASKGLLSGRLDQPATWTLRT